MSTGIPYHDKLDAARREIIMTALTRRVGNRTWAANDLGIRRTTLLELIRKLGLQGTVALRWPIIGNNHVANGLYERAALEAAVRRDTSL